MRIKFEIVADLPDDLTREQVTAILAAATVQVAEPEEVGGYDRYGAFVRWLDVSNVGSHWFEVNP